jgi:branched-chain amino acid transport system substrate-binding protein
MRLIFFVIAAFWFADSARSQDQQSAPPPITIGAILPLSGGASNFGMIARRGIELALESLSPSDRTRVKVVFEDDGLSNARSATAARRLITINKVDALLTLSSGTGITVAGIVEPKQIPHISVASDPAVSKGRTYSFTYCPFAGDEARAMKEYMIQSNKKRVAVISLVHNGALALRDAFVREVGQSGQIAMVANEEVAGDVTDFRAVLQRIKSKGEFGALMTILFPGQLAICIKQARAVGITAQLLGFETFEDKDEIKAAAGLMTGAIYATGADPQPEFMSKYEQLYPGESSYTANQAYDIIRLFVEASRSAKDGDSIVKYLKDVRDRETASGRVSLAADNQFRLPTTVKQIGQDGVPRELESE